MKISTNPGNLVIKVKKFFTKKKNLTYVNMKNIFLLLSIVRL